MKIKNFLLVIITATLCAPALFAVDVIFMGSQVTYSPENPISGNLMTFTATFRPLGGAVDNFKVTGEVDGVKLYEHIYDHIGNQVVNTASFTWTATTGKHYVLFKLDPDNVQGDTDYKNNWQSKSFKVAPLVAPTDGPNLLVKSVSSSPILLVSGNETTFTVTLQNNGTMPANQFEASFRTDIPGSPWQAKHIDVILNGAQKIITFKWKIVCDATITINADEYDAVTELNESDNLWVKKVVCYQIQKRTKN